MAVVITECTYLDDAEIDRARRVGHAVRDVVRFFREREALDNVVLRATEESHLPERHPRSRPGIRQRPDHL
ncbi:hypothetical protein Drose_24400 [Dactylosporangium roseum]|uniref:Uncharacterized protein n=1 Tax=Dactylosporangium roseum TaxID=47989 RepID=A0ABY5YYA2_9ACTN|nr:hypothetical protein [Dactylosporangium roseum]UWZ34366.1 hypothetical protein Drose_24400 [Dactylosporangium roseum]